MHRLAKIIGLIVFFFSIQPVYAQLTPKQAENGLWGFVKGKGKKFKIPPKYKQAYLFHEGVARVNNENAFLLIDEEGMPISESFDFIGWQKETGEQQNATPFINGVIGVKQNDTWGVIDTQLKKVLPISYSDLIPFGNDFLLAKKEKWGLYSTQGEQLYPHTLDSAFLTENNTIVIWEDLAIGMLDSEGKVLQEAIFKKEEKTVGSVFRSFQPFEFLDAETKESFTVYVDAIQSAEANLFWVQREGKWALASLNTKELLTPYRYAEFSTFQGELCKVKNELWGLINSKGEQVLSSKYSEIVLDSVGMVRAKLPQSNAWIYFDRSGVLLSKENYPDWVSETFKNKLYLAKRGDEFGYIDADFRTMIPFEFDLATDFKQGAAVVRKGNYSGIIDSLGQWIIRPVVDSLQILSSETFLFYDRGRWGTLDKNGIEYFVSSMETSWEKLNEGLLLKKGAKYGYVNSAGRQTLPTIFDSIEPYNDTYLRVENEGFHFYAYKYGRQIPTKEACDVWTIEQPLSENYISVTYQNQAGFIDYLCRLRMSIRYEETLPFSEGLAGVKLSGKWGFINTQDRLIIQPYYQSVSSFKNGYAIVEKQQKYGVIDTNGQEVLAVEYDSVYQTKNLNWMIKQEDKLGIVSETFQEIIFPKYDAIEDNNSNSVLVEKMGTYGIDYLNGVHLRFTEYDEVTYWENGFYIFKLPLKSNTLE